MSAVRIGWRLLRQGEAGDRLVVLLSLTAVTVATLVLFSVLAVNNALTVRAERGAWLHPTPASGNAFGRLAVQTFFVDGQPVVVADLARLRTDAPAPPGLASFPEPGTAYASPRLRELLQSASPQTTTMLLGGAALQPQPVGDAALGHPEQLLLVRGQDPGSALVQVERKGDPRRDGDIVSPVPIDRYRHEVVDFTPDAMYVGLGQVATLLVAVPLLVLGSTAGRLGIARRDRRLATLRLLGATPVQVTFMTLVETIVVAAVGTLLGLLGYWLALVPGSRLSVGGGPFFVTDLRLPAAQLALLVVACPVAVGISGLTGMLALTISPLGVARRHTPPGLSVARVVVMALAVIGYAYVTLGADSSLSSIIAALGAMFVALSVVGPWCVAVLGRILVRPSASVVRLLVGRRLLDDPRGIWRTVGGLTMALFVAGFLAPYPVASAASAAGGETRVLLAAPAQQVDTAAATAQQRLAQAGLRASVATPEDPLVGLPPDGRLVEVRVASPATAEQVKPLLADLSPQQPPVTDRDTAWRDAQFSQDYRTFGFLVLMTTFLVAAASTVITTAASVLDRRQVIGLLYLAGTPPEVFQRVNRSQLLVPLGVGGGLGLLGGLGCAAPYSWVSGAPFEAQGLITLTVCLAAGLLSVLGAVTMSGPLVERVCHRPGAALREIQA
ncbi:MAG: ABC transporter permease [Actinomycetia bacterium]|nr:ABC transporter permease [Actinomycetes bacterium]